MGFRVNARTIFQLGSELISSDGIALYELIKNALDARSPEVRINVVCRMEFAVVDKILRELGERRHPAGWIDVSSHPSGAWRTFREKAINAIDAGAPDAKRLREEIQSVDNRHDFVECIRQANSIEVDDDGEGMSIQTLNNVYLTIGTSKRARQRARRASQDRVAETSIPILGEKGIGRLSAMRLGDTMEVVTARSRDNHWNRLRIDWNVFAQSSDDDIDSIDVGPEVGELKDVSDQQGTLIRICALSSSWSIKKLSGLARDEFSKLFDPFSQRDLPLKIAYNERPVQIPAFASFLLEHAHGALNVTYRFTQAGPVLRGLMDYRLRHRRRHFTYRGFEMSTLTGDIPPDTLRRVGTFTLQVYWFNRRILKRIDGIGDLTQVRRILATWAGGVSLYRDGFRVHPYGGVNDDWLDLDRDAFSTSGFKLNRGQIIGRANVTQSGNPYLTDQTNREGLTDGPEKQAFVSLLSAIMEHFRLFLVAVDKEHRRSQRVDADEAIARFRTEDDRIARLLPRLKEALRTTREGRRLVRNVDESLSMLREAAAAVETASTAQEQERGRVIHLASVGLLLEVIAHELYRATSGALDTISRMRSRPIGPSATTSLRVLDAQLTTLQKRLRVLDPLSTTARQVKQSFELVHWVRSIVANYTERAARVNVELRVSVKPRGRTREIRAVKGMFVQVLENLLSNSLYWIVQEQKFDPSAKVRRAGKDLAGSVEVLIEPDLFRITVTDDGPGIPDDRRDIVFEPFFSTKRQKEGRGLGLYISREIAEYHGGTLVLGEANEDNIINSIVFTSGASEDE